MTRTTKAFFILTAASILFFPRLAPAKTVSLPLSIEGGLLSSLVVKDSFPGPDRTALLLDEQDGCKKLVLSDPQYTLQNGRILFETRVFVKAGFHLGGTCILPLTWEGYISLIQIPVISDQWILSFTTIDTKICDKNRQPARIAGFLWDLIKAHVFDYLNQISLNLAPPVAELGAFLKEVFPPILEQRAERMVQSIRSGKVDVRPEAVTVEILTETEGEAEPQEAGDYAFLTSEELDKFISVWETWDVYLVHMITSLPGEHLGNEEREILLDVLLEERHRLLTELREPGGKEDFVRKEFVAAWNRLSPLFRKRMSEDPARPLLDYLAFFTASDALVVLERIGPGLGIEISRDGLIRLARLIGKKEIVDLPYEYGVNSALRDILGLGPPVPYSAPSFEGEFIEMKPEERELEKGGGISFRNTFFVGTAWAQPIDNRDPYERLGPWLVPKGNIHPYLERVKSLLDDASAKSFKKTALNASQSEFHRHLALSIAWQESCFRQFIVEEGKVTYVRSYNRTSVGLMQINERVWRGIYDEKHLRWDISYNASAGCEIVGLYFKKYALPELDKMDPDIRPDQQTQARILYAMYYGGPGQFKKFMERLKKGRPNIMDTLFLDKYKWVTGNQWDKIEHCL